MIIKLETIQAYICKHNTNRTIRMYLLQLAQQKPAQPKYAVFEQSRNKDQHSTGNGKVLLQLGIQCKQHIVRDSKLYEKNC